MPPSVHAHRYYVFLELLRQARLDAGMTQADVAKRLGVAQSYVSKCENGERRMDVSEVYAWLDAVDRDWLEFMVTLGHQMQGGHGMQAFPDSAFHED